MARTDPGAATDPQNSDNTLWADQTQTNGAGPPQESALVLIAEDEAPIAEALAYLVEDYGYIPILAAHGREALELARSRHPRLIITDLMMPIMDGVELIKALRADAASNGQIVPPIIVTTAGGLRRAEEAGADVVLRKPFNIEDIEALLRRFLGSPRASS